MSLGLILLIVLILVLVGGLGGPWNSGGVFYGGGYPVGGLLGVVLLVVLILVVLGRL